MSVVNTSPAKAKLSLCAAIATCVACASIASADTIQIVGLKSASTESLGGYLGTLDYTPGDGVGTLVVTLENISPAANGGFLTGFLFNIASVDVNATAALQPGSTHPFQQASGSGAPFGGDYDSGAALGGSFLGGGNPNNGIAVGATGTFTFLVTAEDADTLTASSFINGPYEHNFVVRFRGFENGGSDKVPAVESCRCDYNHDGVTDAGDMGMFLAGWGPNPGSPLDTNLDGLVDGADFGLFLECWRDCSLN